MMCARKVSTITLEDLNIYFDLEYGIKSIEDPTIILGNVYIDKSVLTQQLTQNIYWPPSNKGGREPRILTNQLLVTEEMLRTQCLTLELRYISITRRNNLQVLPT